MTELIPMLIAAFLTVLSTFLFGGFRIGFVFAEDTVRKHIRRSAPFCHVLWGLIALDSVLLLIGCGLESHKPDLSFGGYGNGFWLLFAFSLLSLVLCALFMVIGGLRTLRQYMLSALQIAPYFALVYAILIYGFIMPIMPFGLRIVLILVPAVLAGVFFAVRCFAAGNLHFEARPCVFMGHNEYTVVFATSVPTVGCLTYNCNGEEKVIWDSQYGIKNVGKLHSVRVPKTELENNAYTVRARRAIEPLPYGGLLGKKEIASSVDHFTSRCEFDVKLLTLADLHGAHLQWNTLPSSCSALLILGDVAESIDSETAFIRDLLTPCFEILHGRRPVIFVRGNHDYRGFKLPQLYSRFGIRHFNYRFSLGGVHFTVLDSGEDKPDEHSEYAGYLDCESYCKSQLNWLERQPVQHGMCIALSHMPTIFCNREDSSRAAELLRQHGVRLLISGHIHQTVFTDAQEDRFMPIHTFAAGAASGETPTYSVISFSGSMAEMKTFDFKTHEELFSKELILYTD
ncbi:MAG: metallophosphoesterase [Clostridia bacterium]|nr:metallophosphoesterase [Clostridia bacterium]